MTEWTVNNKLNAWYQKRYHIKLPKEFVTKSEIYFGGSSFSPSALFALAEPGVWFDPSDLSTLFQDPAGTTPVTAPGNTVGLMLDKSQGLDASTKGGQMDGVVGGSFDTPSATANQITGDIDIRVRASLLSWTPAVITAFCSRVLSGGTTGDSYEFWISTSGVLQLLTVSGTTNTNVASSTSVGFAAGTTNWVRVTWQQSTGFVNFYTSSDGVTWTQNGTANRAGTTSATNAGTRPLRFGARSDGAGSFPLNGKIYRAQIYNGINGTLAVDFNPTLYVSGATYTAATGEVWTITGLYARIVPDGNHATQATLAARPTYSIEPVGGRRNLLLWTEDYSNTVWLKANISPVGSAVTATSTLAYFYQSVVTAAGANRVSVKVKAGTASVFWLYYQSAGNYGVAYFDVSNQTTQVVAGSTGSPTGLTITSLGGGDYIISAQWSALAGADNWGVGICDAKGAISVTSGRTATIYNTQLELGSTATAYQRVTTQYDVTEAGVASVSYLYFDGVNDAMVTSTITPGIDKAQVFAGVRKVSGAQQAIIEFSSNVNSAAGVIGVFIGFPSVTNLQFYSKGTLGSATTVSFAPPVTNVVTGLGDISGDTSTLRVNGAQVAQSTADQGTGNYLAYPLYIGARGGTTLEFWGHLYSLITRFGPTLDAPTIASTETWVAGKTGIVI